MGGHVSLFAVQLRQWPRDGGCIEALDRPRRFMTRWRAMILDRAGDFTPIPNRWTKRMAIDVSITPSGNRSRAAGRGGGRRRNFISHSGDYRQKTKPKKRELERKKKKREKKWTDHGRHSGEKWRDAAGSPRLRAPIRALRRPAK